MTRNINMKLNLTAYKVLLEDSHILQFIYCMWLLSCIRDRAESIRQSPRSL